MTTRPQLNNTTMINEANKFALELVKNKDLLVRWYNHLTQALHDKNYEVQMMDNFIANKSENKVANYQTTYAYVIQAQQKLAAYKMFYWSGLYKTSKKPKGSSGPLVDGDPISVVSSGTRNIATFVSLARDELIEYQFKNLVLTWNTGANPTEGQLIFGLRNISGVATKTFAGMITEGSTKYLYAGVMVNPKSASGRALIHKSPPQTSSSLQTLEFANQIINMVSQGIFMFLNIVMLYKTGKEIQELNSRIGTPEEKANDREDLRKAQKTQEVNNRTRQQVLEKAEDIATPVEDMTPEQFAQSLGEVDNTYPTDDIPSNVATTAQISEGEADTMQATIEKDIRDNGNTVNTTGNDDDNDGDGAIGDGANITTTDAE